MPRIELEGVSCRYRTEAGGSVEGVADLNLEIADGEMLVVMGRSGAGKSTLLRLLAGLEAVASGVIRFDGQRVNDRPAHERDVGMVLQGAPLFPHLTVRENLALGLTLRRAPREHIARAVTAVAERLRLAGLLTRRPGELSGGERQRVGLGRVLARGPRVLLLDEPFANLDGALQRQLRQDLVSVHREAALTTVCVTHSLPEVEFLNVRTAVMEQGRCVQVGSLDELRTRPATAVVAELWG